MTINPFSHRWHLYPQFARAEFWRLAQQSSESFNLLMCSINASCSLLSWRPKKKLCYISIACYWQAYAMLQHLDSIFHELCWFISVSLWLNRYFCFDLNIDFMPISSRLPIIPNILSGCMWGSVWKCVGVCVLYSSYSIGQSSFHCRHSQHCSNVENRFSIFRPTAVCSAVIRSKISRIDWGRKKKGL